MRSKNLIPTGLLTLSLAIAATGAVTAQDAADLAPEVSYSTGTVTGAPAEFVDPTSEEMLEGGVVQMRGWSVVGIPLAPADARLAGQMTFVANGVGQEFAEGLARIESRSYRIENDEGAWSGPGSWTVAVEGDSVLIDQESAVLSGEGAYDGLTAYLFIDHVDGEALVEAVVVAGEAPPAPDDVASTDASS